MELFEPTSKRRRNLSTTGDSLKLIVNEMKDTQSRKIELLEKIVETPEKSELELFFGSICMTVQKLTPLEQAKTKMKILEIVNKAEIQHIQSCEYIYIVDDSKRFNSTPNNSNAIDEENLQYVEENEEDEESLDLR